MKLTHILLLVCLAVFIGVFISMNTDAGTYGTFSDAKSLASVSKSRSIQVIGELPKDEQGKILGMVYEPVKDPNFFQFAMLDTAGVQMNVVYNKPKPQDFDMSEKIVVSGYMDGEVFRAEKILMKCPSKYEDEGEFAEFKEA